MTARATLSLYVLDRPALKELAAELRRSLIADDRASLAATLELGGALAQRLATEPRAVDWFLRPESDRDAAPLFASLRRVAKKRALEQRWTSPTAALEGRLRMFDVIREDKPLAALVDKLLDAARLPWFLVRPGATGGWLDAPDRERLAAGLLPLRPALPREVVEFVSALDDLDGPVIAHDGLGP